MAGIATTAATTQIKPGFIFAPLPSRGRIAHSKKSYSVSITSRHRIEPVVLVRVAVVLDQLCVRLAMAVQQHRQAPRARVDLRILERRAVTKRVRVDERPAL